MRVLEQTEFDIDVDEFDDPTLQAAELWFRALAVGRGEEEPFKIRVSVVSDGPSEEITVNGLGDLDRAMNVWKRILDELIDED